MEDRRNYSGSGINYLAYIKMSNIEKDKFGVKLKFPNRKCIQCIRYPCFKGITRCSSNFASYGCVYYRSKENSR